MKIADLKRNPAVSQEEGIKIKIIKNNSGFRMLKIEKLTVSVGNKEVLKNINLEIGKGETHALFGPNGSGKTTLLMTIMGFQSYKVTKGKIYFMGEDITNMPIYGRAKKGVGIMFQRPPTISGLKTKDMVNICRGNNDMDINALASELNMNKFLERDINAGFSGGEIKRSELLQMLAQNPLLSLIDEPESGVDLENISVIGHAINKLLEKDLHKNRIKSGLIITHTGHILDYVTADVGHLLIDGNLKCTANPLDMLREIKKSGYERCMECIECKIQ